MRKISAKMTFFHGNRKWCADRPSMNKLRQELVSGIDREPQSSTLSENEENSEPSSRRLRETRTR